MKLFEMTGTKSLFITDMGFSEDIMDDKGNKHGRVYRYLVWAKVPGKAQVIDSGDDLKQLLKKHGDVKVTKIGKR